MTNKIYTSPVAAYVEFDTEALETYLLDVRHPSNILVVITLAVQGDRLICDNEPTSPHRFANRFGQAGRNAWKTISLLIPYETQWRPAASYRTQQPNRLYG